MIGLKRTLQVLMNFWLLHIACTEEMPMLYWKLHLPNHDELSLLIQTGGSVKTWRKQCGPMIYVEFQELKQKMHNVLKKQCLLPKSLPLLKLSLMGKTPVN